MEDQMAKRQLLLLANAESMQNGLDAALDHLRDAGWQITSAAGSAEADHLLTTENPTAVLVGYGFEARSAVSWLERIQQLCVQAPVIALLPEAQLRHAEAVLVAGAADYLPTGGACEFLFPPALERAIVRADADQQMRKRAHADPLTGAHNRWFFLELLESELERSQRYRFPVAMMLLDVDGMARINASLGRRVGDQLLRGVAQACRNCLRSTDVFGRYGGDRFVVLAPHSTVGETKRLAQRMRKALAQVRPVVALADPTPITASFGLVEFPADARKLDRLLQISESAVCHAKAAGGNTVHVYTGAEPLVSRSLA